MGVSYNPESIRRSVQFKIKRNNVNNLWRTDYYHMYWMQHPDVLWALLAHLVSRNAGYLMSDLRRCWWLSQELKLKPPVLDPLVEVFALHVKPIFSLLETANYLIFRDACPQLEIYEYARQYPEHSDELFQMLADDFGVDPWMVERWRVYFDLACTSFQDWGRDRLARQAVWEHTMSLVVNEQNQIEDRLLHDPEHRYLGAFQVTAKWLLDLFDAAGFLRLCFPMMPEAHTVRRENLRVYRVHGFADLAKRIETGRNLAAGLFLTDGRKCNRLLTWVRLHRWHHGTRCDYNGEDYSLDPVSPTPFSRKYSPPLIQWSGHAGAWPEHPDETEEFAHLHADPIPLPRPIGQHHAAQVAGGLAPFDGDHGLMDHEFSELAEVVL